MRLLVDGVPLLFRSAGVKNYLYHWLVHLRRAGGPGLSLQVFPRLGVPRAPLDHERSICGPAGTLARLGWWHLMNLGSHDLLDFLGPAADLVHVTKLINPPRRPRLAATIHDMTIWLTPEFHTAANVAAEKALADRVWKRADALIAVSAHTRDDAVRLLGLDPQRIRVIRHGVAEPYFDVPPAEVARVRSLYGLDRGYVLFNGTVEPRKNLAALLDAYESLSSDLRREFAFVVAGPPGWSSEPLLRRLRSAPPGVRYLGYVPEASMPGLFAGAALFAYVSFYEGFGFPVAQALAAGAPVLTSAVSALPEIAGSAAEFVDPRSPSEIRDALDRLLTSPARRSALAAAGRLRAREFRWEICARRSLEFFQEAAGRGGA